MDDAKPTTRTWFVIVADGEARIRCRYDRLRKQILRFAVQLEILHQGTWRPVVRYDNAHGFCHRDPLHPDGTPDKTRILVGDLNESFTYAIEDLRANWEAHHARFLGELQS
jgi:hypothetical protein